MIFWKSLYHPLLESSQLIKTCKISRYAKNVLTKFDLNYVLFRYYILQNKPTPYTISDADFPTVNPNDILTIVAHFRNHQDNDLSMGGYHAAFSFLKDYVA